MAIPRHLFEWTTTEELATALKAARRTMMRIVSELHAKGPTAAEHVAHTYSWAGRPDSEANSLGGQVLKCVQGINARIGNLQQLVADLDRQVKAANDFADDARARRTAAGPTLNT